MSKFLNSKFGLLLTGFILTTILGAIITAVQSREAWKREKQFELLKQVLEQHDRVRTDVSTLMAARAFRAERVLFAVEEPIEPYQTTSDREQRIRKAWDSYYETVITWNENYRAQSARIRHLAGSEVADQFCFNEEYSPSDDPRSICGLFVRVHESIRHLKAAAYQPGDPPWKKLHGDTRHAVNQLHKRIDAFLLELYRSLDARARSDNPLEQ